jgi:hypothetical protein
MSEALVGAGSASGLLGRNYLGIGIPAPDAVLRPRFIRASQTPPITTPNASTDSAVTSWKAVHPMNVIAKVLAKLLE